jgi:hypothetical protein
VCDVRAVKVHVGSGLGRLDDESIKGARTSLDAYAFGEHC